LITIVLINHRQVCWILCPRTLSMLDRHVSPLLNPVDFVNPPKMTVVRDSVWELFYCCHVFREVLGSCSHVSRPVQSDREDTCNLSRSICPLTAVAHTQFTICRMNKIKTFLILSL
uniref:Uncharacterized protein n=1 Tax=Calidris pygmaea TaxID=425635 RepID=A0A8C3PN72_9CHAR